MGFIRFFADSMVSSSTFLFGKKVGRQGEQRDVGFMYLLMFAALVVFWFLFLLIYVKLKKSLLFFVDSSMSSLLGIFFLEFPSQTSPSTLAPPNRPSEQRLLLRFRASSRSSSPFLSSL